MIDIIAGIFIGMTIETFGISMYIIYTRNKNKPNIHYSEELNEELNDNSIVRPSIDHADL